MLTPGQLEVLIDGPDSSELLLHEVESEGDFVGVHKVIVRNDVMGYNYVEGVGVHGEMQAASKLYRSTPSPWSTHTGTRSRMSSDQRIGDLASQCPLQQ